MLPSDWVAQGWCQNMSASDSEGNRVSSLNPKAVKVCAIESVWKTYPESLEDLSVFQKRGIYVIALIHEIHKLVGGELQGVSLVNWNDTPGRTQEEVIEVLRKVEQKLELRS